MRSIRRSCGGPAFRSAHFRKFRRHGRHLCYSPDRAISVSASQRRFLVRCTSRRLRHPDIPPLLHGTYMAAETKNPWHTALKHLETARSEDWANTSRAQIAWDGVNRSETHLFKPAATMQELADKLRYLLAVSVPPGEQELPVARWPWKRRMLMSAIADLDRLDDSLLNIRLGRLGKEARRSRQLIQSVRPLEELQSKLQRCEIALAEIQAERDAARSALARINLGIDLSDTNGAE